MGPISASVTLGVEEVVHPVTGKSVTETEQEVQSGTTIGTGSSFSVYTTKDKRKRCDDDSSSGDEFLQDDDGKEEEEEKKGKRLMTEEEKLSSYQLWYESQLEDNKQSLLKEMREKENKLMVAKCLQKRNVARVASTSVDRLKEELALLRIMYEQLVI